MKPKLIELMAANKRSLGVVCLSLEFIIEVMILQKSVSKIIVFETK
jgi:hypothetical protein